MNSHWYKFFRILPIITLAFTILVIFVFMYVENANSSWLLMIFMSAELYANWIAIQLVTSDEFYNAACRTKQNYVPNTNRNSVVIDLEPSVSTERDNVNNLTYKSNKPVTQVDIKKIQFCPKCLAETSVYCQHCPLCKKCIMLRDHHCFFLGACISMQNMGHFIVLCLYVGVACLYVNSCLFPFLCQHIANQTGKDVTLWHLLAQFFFPVTLSKWLIGQLSFWILSLISLFDVLITAGISTLCFGFYYLLLVTTGRSTLKVQIYDDNRPTSRNIRTNFAYVFGEWGIMNFLFPHVLGKRLLQSKRLHSYKIM